MRSWPLFLLVLLPLLIAAGAAPVVAPEAAAKEAAAQAASEGGEPKAPVRGLLTSGGSFWVTYQPDPDPIPMNEMFTVRFRVTRADDREKLVEGAVVTVDPYMPEHKHSAPLLPKIESAGDGTAVGRGFLLHMEGFWLLRVGVAVKDHMERVNFEIQLEP